MELEALRRLVTVDGERLVARGAAELGGPELEALGLAPREARELFEKLRAAEKPDFELDLATARPPEEFAARFAAAVPSVDKAPVE
jgi:hypothetical protein